MIDALEADDEARVVGFESSTPDFFIAHFDVVKGEDADHNAPGPTGLPLWADLATQLTQLPYVSIASIRGRTRGVGSEFLLACDLRFASELAVLGQPEVGLGLFPGGGGTERLPRGTRTGARDHPRLRGRGHRPNATATSTARLPTTISTPSSIASSDGSPASTLPHWPRPRPG